MKRPVTLPSLMLPALALFGMLCLGLLGWSHQLWNETLTDATLPGSTLAQMRLNLSQARIHAEHDLHPDTPGDLSRVDAELENARIGGLQLVAQVEHIQTSPVHAHQLRRLARGFVDAIDGIRDTLRHRARAPDEPSRLVLDLQQSRIDSAIREMESIIEAIRQERLRRQARLGMGMAALIGLGVGLLLLLHHRQSHLRQSLLDALQQRERHMQAFAEAVPDLSFVLDAEGRYIEIYGSRDRLVATREQLLGQRFHDMLPPPAAARVEAAVRRALETGEVCRTEYMLEIDGRACWFEARTHALPGEQDRVALISWDVTERKRSEQRVTTLGRLYSFLSQVNQAIVWTRQPQELMQRICDVALSHGSFRGAWIATRGNDNCTLVPVAVGPGNRDLPAGRQAGRLDPEQHPQHVVAQTWRSAELRWDTPAGGSALHAVAIPITCEGRMHAVLVLVRDQLSSEDAEERALFHEIGSDLSHALTQMRQHKRWQQDQESMRLHAAALESTQDGVIVCDRSGRIVSVNRAFSAITGHRREDWIGQPLGRLDPPADPVGAAEQSDGFGRLLEQVVSQGAWSGELRSRHRDGHLQTLWASVATVHDEQQVPTHLVTVFTDITAKKQAERDLHLLAHVDPLTQLPNRRMVLDRLSQALAAAQRQQHRVGVLFIDLDNFKTVNDSLGHSCGDRLLRDVAARLAQRTRREDTLGRLGGDEFILVLEALRDQEDAAMVARELLQLLDRPFQIDGSEVWVQASIGISLYPEDGHEVEELLRDADAAMYQAKHAGRGTYRYYTEALTQAAQSRLQLDGRLRRALERNEFELWYQPLYRLADRHLIGLEALVRLNQPGLPPIGPAEFIPLMEDSGLIVELGAWVTRQACQQARAWLDEGLDCGRIAVNLSAAEMRRGQTLARLSQALHDSGLPAARLELEITESGLMEHSDAVEPVLWQMREMGVRLAIDDFGTGYSSLARLKRLPVGKLKIDRSFIADLDGGDGVHPGAQLVSAMIAMGRGLGLSVLAEGIETEAQARQLIALGCEAGQGYLFGRPAPAALAREWLSPLPENAGEALAQTIWPDI
ncbi:MAG: hypothetical protein RL654_2036 [Pseudomonadota bacterium]|jgi:diguanylate cyclase (GGDEF)-like protein/PAS domain S-box-containing protein